MGGRKDGRTEGRKDGRTEGRKDGRWIQNQKQKPHTTMWGNSMFQSICRDKRWGASPLLCKIKIKAHQPATIFRDLHDA